MRKKVKIIIVLGVIAILLSACGLIHWYSEQRLNYRIQPLIDAGLTLEQALEFDESHQLWAIDNSYNQTVVDIAKHYFQHKNLTNCVITSTSNVNTVLSTLNLVSQYNLFNNTSSQHVFLTKLVEEYGVDCSTERLLVRAVHLYGINPQLVDDLKSEMSRDCYEYTCTPIFGEGEYHVEHVESTLFRNVTNEMFRGYEFKEKGYLTLLDLIDQLNPRLNIGVKTELSRSERVRVLALYFLYINYSAPKFKEHFSGLQNGLDLVGNYSGLVKWDPQKVDVLVALCEDLPENVTNKYPYWILSAADVLPYYFYYMGKTTTLDISSERAKDVNWHILTRGMGANNAFDERTWAVRHIRNILTDIEDGRYFDPKVTYSLTDPKEIIYIERALLVNPSLAEFYPDWKTVRHPNSVNDRVWGYYFSNTTINVLNIRDNWYWQDYVYRPMLEDLFNGDSLNISYSELISEPGKAGSIVLSESAPEAICEMVNVAWQHGKTVDKATLYVGTTFHENVHVTGCCYDWATAAVIFWQSIGLPTHRAGASYFHKVGHSDIAIYMSEQYEKALRNSTHDLLRHPLIKNHLIALAWPSKETCAIDRVSSTYIDMFNYGTEVYSGVYTPGGISKVSVIDDVNFDDVLDLVASSKSGDIRCLDGVTGSSIWSSEGNNFIILNDTDGDRINDIFTIAGTYEHTRLSLLSGVTGSELLSKSTGGRARGYQGPEIFPLGDVNEDGFNDVLVYWVYGHATCFSGRDLQEIWKIQTGCYYGLAVVNNHAKSNFVVNYYDSVKCHSSNNGRVLWVTDNSQYDWYRSYISNVGDIDRDGVDEIIISGITRPTSDAVAFLLSGTDGELLWNITTERTCEGTPDRLIIGASKISDVNTDGKSDILAMLSPSGLLCLDGSDGSILWENSNVAPTCIEAINSLGEDPGNVVVGALDGVCLLSGKDGTQLWMSCFTIAWVDDIFVNYQDLSDGSSCILAGTNFGQVFYLNGSNGRIKWDVELE